MKKLSTLMTMALVAMMTLTLTSCDEDYDIAYTLEGTWRGNMYVSSVYDGYTYDATYTELCFVQDPYRYSSGTGYWIDHYAGDAPWRYVANHTEWKVRGGVIRIHLMEEDTYIEIANYRLDDNYFYGTIYYDDTKVKFRMNHTSSPNWNDYDYGYDYWTGYYAKPAPGVRAASGDAKPMRVFRTQE